MNSSFPAHAPQSRVGAYMLFAVSLGVAAVIIGANYLTRQAATGEDLCLATGPSGILVLAIDATDRLSEAQQLHVRNLLGSSVESLTPNWRVEVWDISPTTGVARQAAPGICKPKTDVSWWNGNPMRARQSKALFDATIGRQLSDALSRPSSDESPIIEGLQAIGLRSFGAPSLPSGLGRRLILVSDLLQNTRQISFLHGLTPYDTFKVSDTFNVVRPPIVGAEVEILFLSRPASAGPPVDVLIRWWQALFADCRARITSVEHIVG